MKRVFRLLCRMHESASAQWNHILAVIYRPRFGASGKDFSFDPRGEYTFSNIYVGNDVSLGERPYLIAGRSRIVIGSHVMFGPEVTIRGGNHRTDVIGKFMKDVRDEEKRPEDDPGVVIEDDVWVGTRAVILAGVRIGRGAVVGAGAVVTRDVPPYGIVIGNPARLLRSRWDVDSILEHERRLYSESQRLKREDLEGWQREQKAPPSNR